MGDLIAEQLVNRIDIYDMNGSGWIVSRLIALDTTMWLLDALRGSTFHQLPEWIRLRKAVQNIQNDRIESTKTDPSVNIDEENFVIFLTNPIVTKHASAKMEIYNRTPNLQSNEDILHELEENDIYRELSPGMRSIWRGSDVIRSLWTIY